MLDPRPTLDPGGADVRLSPEQLLALQLHARGYALAQIAPLMGLTPDGVAAQLSLAARRLGTATLVAAVTEARRRRLIA